MSKVVMPARPAVSPGVESGHGCYLYGIVRAGTRTPPGAVLVRHRQLAAVVRPDQPWPVRPTRQDLLGHAWLLDRLAETDPVLPMRFGTVVDSPAAVVAELLAPHHDALLAALTGLAGRAQFLVSARYQTGAVVAEVLAEQPELVRLHQQLRGQPGAADPFGRVRLGELVARAVARKRAADTDRLAAALRPYTTGGRLVEGSQAGPEPVAELAVLVEHRHRDRFESAAERLARQWHGRVRLRLRGPMAPYHFTDGLVGARPGGRQPWG